MTLSVLVQADRIWVGLSRVNEFQEIPKKGDDQDWDKFETTLKEHKASAFFADRADIEIAGEITTQSPVEYQDVIHAMDVAVKVGFIDVGLTDPAGLAARPQHVRRRPCRYIQQAHASTTRSVQAPRQEGGLRGGRRVVEHLAEPDPVRRHDDDLGHVPPDGVLVERSAAPGPEGSRAADGRIARHARSKRPSSS